VEYVIDEQQLGSVHAVKCGLPAIPVYVSNLILLTADMAAKIPSESINKLFKRHKEKNRDITILINEVSDPTGLGRIVFNKMGKIKKIVREDDALTDQKQIKTVDVGIYCVKKDFLLEAIPKIIGENTQEKNYLSDLVAFAYKNWKKIYDIDLVSPIQQRKSGQKRMLKTMQNDGLKKA